MDIDRKTLLNVLEKRFGHNSFRFGQEEIIESILLGSDTLVVMPTGGGKSLCYQLPALILDGTAIVISPLIALMKDQVDALQKSNIATTFINSTLSFPEITERFDRARNGEYKLIYIAPERLQSNMFTDLLGNLKISFLAVDEAHCISEWGHDFRPSYLLIPNIKEIKPQLATVALTATATPEVQQDIVACLKMKSAKKYIRGFDRPNLNYITENCKDKVERLTKQCKKYDGGSTIIYCGTRKRTEEFAEGLKSKKITAYAYHAGMNDQYRKFVQDRFINEGNSIIIATNAFGMGINKANVRNVIHCDYPLSLEAYYQEAGRAGRDGQPADCLLLYNKTDNNLPVFFIKTMFPEKEDIISIYDTLLDSAQVKVGEKPVSPIPYQEDSLASKAFVKENIIDSTIKLLEKYGILQRYNLNSLCRVKLNGSFFSIIDYFKAADENKKMIIEAILRTISSEAFNREVDFDRARIIEKYNVKEKELEKIIKQMESAGLMTYEEAAKSNGVLLLQERQPIDKLRIDFAAHDKRRKRAYSKLDIVMNYAATAECKRNFLLEYFQEDDVQGTCGRCSSCMATESPVKTVKLIIDGLSLNSVEKKILFGAKELNGRYGRTILAEVLMGKESEKLTNWGLTKAKSFGMLQEIKTRHEVIAEIDKLIEDGTLALTPGIYPLVRITESGKKQLKENPPEFKPVQKNSAIIKPSPLFDRLSRLREQFAKENNMLASQLIDTNTLKVLSSTYPMSILDFNRIAAGKTYFLENFSMAFFNEIIDYYDEQERLANPKPELPDSVKKSIEVINHAGNLELAAKKLNISTGELARQVQTAIEYGISLNRGLFIKPKEYEEIKKVVSKQPNLPLKDIRAKLGFDCDYSILRIAVAFVRGEVKK